MYLSTVLERLVRCFYAMIRNCLVLTTLFFVLRDQLYFHCCNQWGCMSRYFGCRCCRKYKKIYFIKKNYNNNHIIIINPYDNNYKLGTVLKP